MKNSFEVDIFRHSTSPYKNYDRVAEDPLNYVDYNDQVSDIDELGKILARTRAEEFVGRIDPNKEIIVLVSSKEARAYETAKIFFDELKKASVEVYDGVPSQKDDVYPIHIQDQEPNQDIVLHDIPSLTGYSSYLDVDKLEGSPKANYQHPNITDQQRETYLKARELVEEKGAGSWGANYFKFQGEGPEFEGIPTIEENTRNMIRGLGIIRRLHANKKTEEYAKSKGKKIRYVVFTHEENMFGLQEYADDHTVVERIGNCDSLHLTIPTERQKFKEKFAKVLYE